MTLKKNIFANYLGAGVIALVSVFALPWYLEALGPKQFGLIGFITMLQGVLSMLDAGMSQALVREITMRLGLPDSGRRSAATLIFGFERIYWLFALCAGCATFLLSNIISHWINAEGLPDSLVRYAIYGAAVIFAVQFPGSLYRSLLVGLQAQVTLNSIMLTGALLRHIGGVMIVTFVSPTLTAYLIWQTLVALLETFARGKSAWGTLNIKRNQVKFDIKDLCKTWKFILAMSGATWLGALVVQMDKIVLSRIVPIEQFGYYSIAAAVSIGMLQLIYPLTQAVFPHAIHFRSDPMALRKLSIKMFLLIGLIIGFCAVIFILVGKWLLYAWLKNTDSVEIVYPLLSVLLIGTGLNAFYNVGYMNWMVYEKTNRVFQVNVLSLMLSITLIPVFVAWYGVVGAAFGWLSMNLIGLLFSLGWLKR